MPRRYSHAVIFGALALIPLGIGLARIAQRIIVDPVTEALPGSLILAAQDLAGEGSGCASPARSLLFWPKRPVAKAYLERDEVSAPPGAHGIEHLVVVEAGAQTDWGSEARTYQASTVPVFEHGSCQGVRFADVAPQSVYANLGIRTDDVIRRVDGREIDSPEQALEIYSKLLQQRRVEVEVERNGRPSLEVFNFD